MTKQVMQYRICDNHPDGREVPAVVIEKLALNGARVELDLCQPCSDELYSAYCRWADIGTPIGGRGTIFDGQRKITGPLVIDLDGPEEGLRPTCRAVRGGHRRGVQAGGAACRWSRHSGQSWVFIDHAIDRLNERGLNVDEALLAAERPDTVLPSKNGQGRKIPHQGRMSPSWWTLSCTRSSQRTTLEVQEEDFEFTPAKKAVGAR